MPVRTGGGRPADGYRMPDGTPVEGVTTIVGRVKDSGPLIGWAYNQGKAGKPRNEAKDKACSVGKISHAMVDADIHERDWVAEEGDIPSLIEQARKALAMWQTWKRQTRFRALFTEMPLLDEIRRYGGTPDGVAMVGDEVVLYDLKSSNGIYQDHLLQLGGYAPLVHLHRERLDVPFLHGAMVVRVGKDSPTFATQYWDISTIDRATKAFYAALEFYRLDKALKECM